MITAERLRELLHYDPVTGAFTWKVKQRAQSPVGSVAGTAGSHGYRQIRVEGTIYLAHRLAWLYVYGVWPLRLVDHANNVRLDNRIINLRAADRSKNAANCATHRDNVTGLKGAHPTGKRGKFKAEIFVGGRNRHLGTFETAVEAHEAYCRAAVEMFGEYARRA